VLKKLRKKGGPDIRIDGGQRSLKRILNGELKMNDHLPGTHDQSTSDPETLAMACPVEGKSEVEIMKFIKTAHESEWYLQVKMWLENRPDFATDHRVRDLFDRACKFIIRVVEYGYDGDRWWDLLKMIEDERESMAEFIILASFTQQIVWEIKAWDRRMDGFNTFTEIFLGPCWDSSYRDLTTFLCEHYEDTQAFVASLLACDDKIKPLLAFVLSQKGVS